MEDRSAAAPGMAQRAVTAGLASLAGLAVGGPPGAIVGAVAEPILEPLMGRVWDEMRGDGRRRMNTVVQTAADSLGDDPDRFEDRARATEQTRLLTATAMEAGMRTAWPPKVRALGRALAAGLADDAARVDEEQLLIGALADLEAPHARVLDLLITKKWSQTISDTAPYRASWAPSTLTEREKPPARYPEWTAEQIGSALANLKSIIPTLLGTLQRHGLVTPKYDLSDVLGNLATDNGDGTFEIDTSGPDEPTIMWSATGLGLKLHTLLDEAASDTTVPEKAEH